MGGGPESDLPQSYKICKILKQNYKIDITDRNEETNGREQKKGFYGNLEISTKFF